LLVQRLAPNLEDQVSVFMTPGDRVAQLYPQVLGTHFSRLLRHAWVTVGLFFNPGHHTGRLLSYFIQNKYVPDINSSPPHEDHQRPHSLVTSNLRVQFGEIRDRLKRVKRLHVNLYLTDVIQMYHYCKSINN
jgi:hypothetical protein